MDRELTTQERKGVQEEQSGEKRCWHERLSAANLRLLIVLGCLAFWVVVALIVFG